MSSYGAPFVGSIKQVEDQWIDYNGHFNMAYYAVLFDRTCDEAFELVGLGEEYLKTGASFFTLETHTSLRARASCRRQGEGDGAAARS
jgi:acyl-CoA thioester hydrolase